LSPTEQRGPIDRSKDVSDQSAPGPKRRPRPRAWLTARLGGRALLERLERIERVQKQTAKELDRTQKQLERANERIRALRAADKAARAQNTALRGRISDLAARVQTVEVAVRDQGRLLREKGLILEEQVKTFELHLVESMAVRRDLDALADPSLVLPDDEQGTSREAHA
jgi:TolA-binding protein